MPATSKYLAFDLGASSGRAVLGEFDGTRLRLEEIHRFENGPVQILGSLHWDVASLFEEIKTGLAKCAARDVQLDGVGIDTWGVDFGLFSAAGDLLGLPYHYRDSRTQGMFAEAFNRVPRQEIYSQTGIQFMELNTLYQLLALKLSPSTLLESADTLLFMPNLLNFWLTGVRQSEYSIASTSQLYDSVRGAWATTLFDKLGIPAGIMPDVVPPGTPVGAISQSVLEETGLKPTTVIAPACHDTGSAVAAVPAQNAAARDDWAYISSGTWSLVGVELTEPITNAEALAANFTNEGGVAGTIRFLSNVAGLWLVQECRRIWADQGDAHSFQELSGMAAAAPARVSFIDPDLPVFAEPGDMPTRIRNRCATGGQPIPESKGEIVRCALESLALKYDHVLTAAERLTARSIKTLHVVGGGVNNTLLCQLTADATGRPVIAGPSEATAIGNIMVQGLARGRVSSLDEIRESVAQSTELKRYEPHASADWEDARQRFSAVLAKD